MLREQHYVNMVLEDSGMFHVTFLNPSFYEIPCFMVVMSVVRNYVVEGKKERLPKEPFLPVYFEA